MRAALTVRYGFYCLFIILVLATTSLRAFASCDQAKQQQTISALGANVKIELDSTGVPAWIRGEIGPRISTDPVQSAIAALKRIADIFCATSSDDFVFSGRIEKEDKLGQTHVRIDQTYRGLPVLNRELIVHMTRDSVIIINGQFASGINVPIVPTVDSQQASQAALQHIQEIGGVGATVREVRSPVVFIDDSDKAHLVYPVQVIYRQKAAYRRDDVFVDAIRGSVVGLNPKIMSGEDREIYDGSGGGYICGSSPVYPLVPLILGENGSSDDPIATAAYDNTGNTYDYYWSIFSRDSYDNAGGTLYAVVHDYCDANNADWDGHEVMFGDGDGVNYGPFPEAVDIVSHEWTHAVDQYTANLNYGGVESGALNESFSDVLGESSECWILGSCDWRLGETIYFAGSPSCAVPLPRCMYNPPLDGLSVDYYPNLCTQGECADVHFNSGIGNLAYYLLVNGGSQPQGYTTTQVHGIGVDEAQQIWYRTLTLYLTSGSGYASTRTATAQAAADLYGYCNQEWQSTQSAWDAVGVPGTWSCKGQTQGETLTTQLIGSGTVTATLKSGQLLSGSLGCGQASSCSGVFTKGSSINETAIPPAGNYVTWMATGPWGKASGTGNGSTSYGFAMNGPVEYTAYFGPVRTLTATVSGSGSGTEKSSDGHINCSPYCSWTYASGTPITLTAAPNGISYFAGWSGSCSGTNPTFTLTLNGNDVCGASFGLRSFTLQVTSTGTGSGTITSSDGHIDCGPTCSYAYQYGSTVTLTAVANGSSTFVSWPGCTNYAGGPICKVVVGTASIATANFLANYVWRPAVQSILY
jgi:Zn-dependent metalloprotease